MSSSERTGLMAGKRGLIMGLANDKSIAWGIAKQLSDHGAEIALSYQGEAMKKRAEPLARELGSDLLFDCDVSDEDSVKAMFDAIEAAWGKIDFLVHAIGYSDKEQLRGRYVDTTRDNFLKTMDISVFSFTMVARYAAALMTEGGSMVTLTYYGAERVMPHYNVMGVAKSALEASVRYLAEDLGKDGIRVNGISAGPIKTLAAAGIGGFRKILGHVEENAPMRRTVTIEEVGNVAAFLCSDLASAVTGEVTYVDSGYNILGMTGLND